jgi:hypothetical protein
MTDDKLSRRIEELRNWMEAHAETATSGELFEQIQITSDLKKHLFPQRPLELRREMGSMRMQLYQRAKAKRAAERQERQDYWARQMEENLKRIRQSQGEERAKAKGASA